MSTKNLSCTKIVWLAAIAALADFTPQVLADEPLEGSGIATAGPGVGEIDNAYGHTLKKEPADKEDEGEPAAEDDKRITVSLGIDWTSAYYARGYRQEDKGGIVQPWAEIGFTLHKWEDGDFGVFLGTWNSVHGKKTGAADTASRFVSKWYESDVYAGLALNLGKFSFSTTYMAATSPNDAFVTCEEWQGTVSFDDSEYLGAWAMNPSVLVVYETGDGFSDGIGPRGVFLEPSIAPGFTWEGTAVGDVEFEFPVTVGLSLSNYFSDSNGDDSFCGYETIGAKATLPLPFNEKFGEWNLTAGVTVLFLNGSCKEVNDGHATEVIGTVGISCEF